MFLLLLSFQPTVGFILLSDFLPFLPFLTQLSLPSYSHYLYIFFDALNPSYMGCIILMDHYSAIFCCTQVNLIRWWILLHNVYPVFFKFCYYLVCSWRLVVF